MVNLNNVWAVVRMERRHTRRLARYWVFLVLAYLLGLGLYIYYSVLHALFSSLSASVGMVGPRYLVSAIGLYYLLGFVLGIVFLGFDVRARDVREGIVEVLDARPLTNFELVTGRFVALFLSAWIPIVVLALLMEGLGFLLPLLGSPVGATLEPLSLVNFVVFMAAPALVFSIGLVFVITLLVRHRLIAALIAIAALVGIFWALFTTPSTVAGYFDFIGIGQITFPSDFVPGLLVPGGWLHRAGVLAMGLGLVGIAAAIHPRLDARKSWVPAASSAGLVVAGFAAIALVVQMRSSESAQVDEWRAAHEARVSEPAADIVSIDGKVSIDPGRNLAADLVVELQAPAEQGLSRVLFTLNPGLRVEEVSTANGSALGVEHANGLLDIALDRALAPGERTSLRLRYAGRPDTAFGYLDSTLKLETATMSENQVGILGYERGLFDRRYVALVSGIRWLPAAGVDVRRDDPRIRPTDYFTIALNVELPSTWLAAGPGKRQTVSTAGDRTTFRFAPQPAVPEVALMAAELKSFATEIDGITFEVLVHPNHDRNFAVLADARAEIEQWVADRLEVARDSGLEYPFDGFTAVEVPNTLRSYKGGWRLDTALAPPAMMLLRETSFPTARFDFDVIEVFSTRNLDQEGGKPRIDRDRLVNFFSNDLSGGNILAGAARSFFVHRTSASGREGVALDFILEDLSTLLVSGRRSYFSAQMFTNINQAVTAVMNNLQGANAISEAVIRARTLRTDVWNAALETPLSDIDPSEDPQRALDTLTLKGGKLAEVIRDRLGANAIGQLLARLVDAHAGSSFSLADFIAAGESVSPELKPLIEDWISSTALPGFVVRGVEQYRLPDDDTGSGRYQLLVRLGNEEPVVGFTRIAWAVPGRGTGGFVVVEQGDGAGAAAAAGNAAAVVSRSGPIRIAGGSASEFGVVLSVPATNVRVLPYLSLNRDDFVAAVLPAGEPPLRNVEPFEGSREIPFELGRDARIVADDLDETFTIASDAGEDNLRLGGQGDADEELDQGLPIATSAFPSRWSRRQVPASWGRYRHTFASIRAGEGTARAVMPVQIPTAGTWELEIYLPQFMLGNHSRWNLEIVSADGRETVEYDASAGSEGWNLIGEYQLPAGEVRVELSDRAERGLIIADAVAWSPVRTFGSEAVTAQ